MNTYSVSGLEDGDGGSSSSREVLQVRHGLSKGKCTNQNSKEHLETQRGTQYGDK